MKGIYPMSKKNKKRSAASVNGSTARREQTVATPEVIYLPEDVREQAEQVLQNTELQGEVSAIRNNDSADLYEAATSPVEALTEYVEQVDNVRIVPTGEIVDAEYHEIEAIPPAELAAGEILREQAIHEELQAANDLNAENPEANVREIDLTQHPIDVLFDRQPEPAEVQFSEFTFGLISEGGLWLLKKLNQVKLRAIAFGNDVVDSYNKTATVLHTIWVNKTNELINWSTLKLHQWHEYSQLQATAKRERSPATKAEFDAFCDALTLHMNDMSERIVQITDLYQQEMRRMSSRITSLEKELHRNTKAFKKVAPVNTEQLALLVAAITQGRKMNAVNLYREITGSELAAAKEAVESMLPV